MDLSHALQAPFSNRTNVTHRKCEAVYRRQPPGVCCVGAAFPLCGEAPGSSLGGEVIADGQPGVPDGSPALWPRKLSWLPKAVVYLGW